MRVRNKACALNVLSMNSSCIIMSSAYYFNSILKFICALNFLILNGWCTLLCTKN